MHILKARKSRTTWDELVACKEAQTQIRAMDTIKYRQGDALLFRTEHGCTLDDIYTCMCMPTMQSLYARIHTRALNKLSHMHNSSKVTITTANHSTSQLLNNIISN